jgi:hypothetical protein
MAEQRNNDDGSQARREAAALLGVDIDHMSPADGLRVDMISALRLVVDAEQASILSGGSADLGKLNVAVQSLIALLPGRALPEPESSREADPRTTMWLIYKQMRERGELPLRGELPGTDEGLQAKIDEQAAEIERLRARLGLAPVPLDVPTSDITPPGEIGSDCYAGIRPGPDDPKPPVTIEGKAAKRPKPSAAPAEPAYDYNTNQSWRDHVLPDGTITPTPMSRGRWWGPV